MFLFMFLSQGGGGLLLGRWVCLLGGLPTGGGGGCLLGGVCLLSGSASCRPPGSDI